MKLFKTLLPIFATIPAIAKASEEITDASLKNFKKICDKQIGALEARFDNLRAAEYMDSRGMTDTCYTYIFLKTLDDGECNAASFRDSDEFYYGKGQITWNEVIDYSRKAGYEFFRPGVENMYVFHKSDLPQWDDKASTPNVRSQRLYDLGCNRVPEFERCLYALKSPILDFNLNEVRDNRHDFYRTIKIQESAQVTLPIHIIKSAIDSDKSLSPEKKAMILKVILSATQHNGETINIMKETKISRVLRQLIESIYIRKTSDPTTKRIQGLNPSDVCMPMAWDSSILLQLIDPEQKSEL